jgi:hypothetical protein
LEWVVWVMRWTPLRVSATRLFPRSAMKANCDNWEQPDTFVYLHNLRLTQPGAIQQIQAGYMNEFTDQKQEPTSALIKPTTSEIQQVLDMPRL